LPLAASPCPDFSWRPDAPIASDVQRRHEAVNVPAMVNVLEIMFRRIMRSISRPSSRGFVYFSLQL
jgi:hypothetical protein